MSLKDGLFKFPPCQVSQSIIELKELINNVINEAIESKEDAYYSGRLLKTVRNIFEMYNDILPVSHNESLRKFPLNCALGYNNCMYLAHECLEICIPTEKLPATLKQKPLTFADIVPKLRQTGVEVFMGQMKQLKEHFLTKLKTGLNQLDQNSHKCMEQVLQELTHIKSLWQDTLPLSNYRRSIGTILNFIVEELVHKVIVLEDISDNDSQEISVLFTTFQEKAPEVFVLENKKETTIYRHVKKWNRFKELIVILNSSMREIEDRWSCGKGPLANEFTAEEIKRMIQALFQNSDLRSSVLSRIR